MPVLVSFKFLEKPVRHYGIFFPTQMGAKVLKKVVILAAVTVFAICLYTFFLGNEILDGKFKNDPFSWYFLAKGIFCGLSLYLSYLIIETLRK